MANQETRSFIDKRKLEMLKSLFEAVGRRIDNAASNRRGKDVTEAIDQDDRSIGKLVKHFRELLKIEEKLPENIEPVNLSQLISDPDKTGLLVEAIRYAVTDIMERDPQNEILIRHAYENTYSVLENLSYFDSSHHNKILPNAADLYKIAGQAVVVAPRELLEDDELYKTFLQEVGHRDDLRDKNTLMQTVLSFARSHDRKGIAISAIRSNCDICEKFIIDNFDWICEGASAPLIGEWISIVEKNRNGDARVEKLLKRLAEAGGLSRLVFSIEKHRTYGDQEFATYLVKWVLQNLPSVKNHDLRNLTYVALYEDFTKLVDELEKRSAWQTIAYIRVDHHGMEGRHYAQRILDHNVTNIPISVDIDSNMFEFESIGDDGLTVFCHSVFAMIGAIGLEEQARLCAVERIKEEGGASETAKRILANIIKGHERYRNATVEEAARQALDELTKCATES